MRNGFTAIQKEWDFVAAERQLEQMILRVEVSHQHSGLAVAAARADELQDPRAAAVTSASRFGQARSFIVSASERCPVLVSANG